MERAKPDVGGRLGRVVRSPGVSPAEGAFYAKDGFESGETCWSCICSTEEMIYNKMYRRNRELFNADKNCELTKPYETLAKVGETGESAKAPRRAGR